MNMENDSLIGKHLGAYLLQAELGRGGMARVYKAYHPRLRREVAIKVILAQIADREGFQARFEREAQVVANLEHPNIVSVYDFASEGHFTYLVMQYVGGGTLRDQLCNKRPLEPLRAALYTIQMARALHHAHQRGIIHRDVKPQNMLVATADPNHLLLSDFGIAKIYQGGKDLAALSDIPTRANQDLSLTHIDQIIGTAEYMAPEQARGLPVDARTDVYALGVVLYQMLTGEVPFHSSTLQGLLFQHVYTPPPGIREKNPQVPEILAQVANRALAKEPMDRFQSAEEMAQALNVANINATNPLASFGQASAATSLYPQGGPAGGSFTPRVVPPSPARFNLSFPGQSGTYTTRPTPVTGASPADMTQPAAPPLPTTSPTMTGTPISLMRKHPFPLSYALATLVLLACLAVVGTRFLPLLASGHSGLTTTAGQAQAFSERFQNNDLGWQTGPLNQGITATVPGGGQYSVTVPLDQTAFPYPQNVGTLPSRFTLTAVLSGSVQDGNGAFYGVALHFNQSGNGLSCYAFVINNAGNYQVIKYESATGTPIASVQGTYNTPRRANHTLVIQARDNTYTFSIDHTPVLIPTNSNPLNTLWNDRDLQGGRLALVLAGPSRGSSTAQATYTISLLHLTIP